METEVGGRRNEENVKLFTFRRRRRRLKYCHFMKSVPRFLNKFPPPPLLFHVQRHSTVLRGVVSREDGLTAEGISNGKVPPPLRRENRSRCSRRRLHILSPLFEISNGSKCLIAFITSRLYCDNVLRGSLRGRGRVLRDLLLFWISFLLLLFKSCFSFKKNASVIFCSFFINERRGEGMVLFFARID